MDNEKKEYMALAEIVINFANKYDVSIMEMHKYLSMIIGTIEKKVKLYEEDN